MTYSEFRNQFPTVEEFMQAYGVLSYEEAKAMINEEIAPTHIKACMISKWREAKRVVKLQHTKVNVRDDGSISIVFYEDRSGFDGNDFEYRYTLDAGNAKAFLSRIPHEWVDAETNVEEWLIENVNCSSIGGDLQQIWTQMGLHGTHVVREDYPGGIYREEEF